MDLVKNPQPQNAMPKNPKPLVAIGERIRLGGLVLEVIGRLPQVRPRSKYGDIKLDLRWVGMTCSGDLIEIRELHYSTGEDPEVYTLVQNPANRHETWTNTVAAQAELIEYAWDELYFNHVQGLIK